MNRITKELILKEKYNTIIYWNNYSFFEKYWIISSYNIFDWIKYINFPFLFRNTNSQLLLDLKNNNLIENINFSLIWNTTNCEAIEIEIKMEKNKIKSFLRELIYLSLEKRFWFYNQEEFINKILNIFPEYSLYFSKKF